MFFTVIGIIALFIVLCFISYGLFGVTMLQLHMTGFSVASTIATTIAVILVAVGWYFWFTYLPFTVTYTGG